MILFNFNLSDTISIRHTTTEKGCNRDLSECIEMTFNALQKKSNEWSDLSVHHCTNIE